MRQRAGTALWAAAGGSLWASIAWSNAAIVGAALGTASGAVLANKIDAVLSSPTRKTRTAKRKKELADAIINQDWTKLDKLLNTIIVAEGIDFVTEDKG